MCPVCVTTLAQIAVGATSTGGAATLIVSTSPRQEQAEQGERLEEQGEPWRTGKSFAMNTPPIVSSQEWEAARQQLLVKEKALTRARDALAAERRRMPWLAVEKAYEFDGPGWQGRACSTCSKAVAS